MCECEFKPKRSTRRRGNVTDSTTGTETDTDPKDGGNSRSSKLSVDLANNEEIVRK